MALGTRFARGVIAVASWLVPAGRRREWREEWEAELTELLRRAGRVPARYGSPSAAALRYASGAFAHSLWELKEEWSMDRFRQELRYAVRTLVHSPAFAAVAVVTLALGVGANATIFSLVNRVLFRAPPGIAAPERLVQIGRNEAPERFDNWPWPAQRAFRERLSEVYRDVAGYAAASVVVGRGADARAGSAHLVTGSYFRTLGVEPSPGRAFLAGEADDGGGAPVAVISHELWRSRFGADRGVSGREVVVDGRPYEVVGVAPPGFAGVDVFRTGADVFLPMGARSALRGRDDGAYADWGRSWVWVVARLAPGVSHERAETATHALIARLGREHPAMGADGGQVVAGVGVRPAERAEAGFLSTLLVGLAALVLVIACANLAGLALARGLVRRREIGVRLALGARRTHIVRQLLTESLLLGGAGGVVAVGVAFLAARGLSAVMPIPVSVGFGPDVRVFGLALATGLAAGVGFGLLPAVTASRPDLLEALKRTPGAGGAGRGAVRAGGAMVVAQVALSFVLVAATALLVRSVHNARTVDPGFDPDGVFVVTLDPGAAAGFDRAQAWRFWRDAQARVAGLPGVDAVGLSEVVPIADFQPNRTALPVDGPPPAPGRAPPPVFTNRVGAGYFDALRIPLLRGRTFRDADARSDAPVVVVSERFVERFGPDGDPIGRALPFAVGDGRRPTIVGVVADHRTRGLAEPPVATVFAPPAPDATDAADGPGRMNLVVRARDEAGEALGGILQAATGAEAGVPVVRAEPLRELVAGSLRSTRLTLRLAGVMGLLAVVLAAVGVHGLLACSIARRRREIGIRIALGARTSDVLRLVLGRTAGLLGVGLAIGVAAALGALRSLTSLLYGVRPGEPATLAAVALLLTLVGIAAGLGPARRAARTDPVDTIQEA